MANKQRQTEESSPQIRDNNITERLKGRNDNVRSKKPHDAGGDGFKKIGSERASTRWGQEWLSSEDYGQHPDRVRSPGERELSGYDDNTTTVGQPGERENLGGSNRWGDQTVSSGGLKIVTPRRTIARRKVKPKAKT